MAINAGHLMSLAALQRHDPYINKLLDVTGQVALYNFNSKANEWEKTEVEGTLFVYARSASPHHGFTIMNRLSAQNLVEPINKDLEFQLQDPFLLYRNGNLGIYSIWFYDKKDCQRIAQLMVKIVKQEVDHAKRRSPERAEAGRSNGVAEPRPIDILELLSKAKEEYQRTQSGETEVSAEGFHTMVKQITVEELFGSSLPKEPSLMAAPSHNSTASTDLPTAFVQKQPYPPQQSPCIPSVSNHQQQKGSALIPAPYVLNHSPVFHSVVPRQDPQSQSSISSLMMSPSGSEHLATPSGPIASPVTPSSFLGQDLVGSLKPAASSVNSGVHKPVLAPSFLPSALVPPHSFQESNKEVFSQPPSLINPVPAFPVSPALAVPVSEMSVLLSPSVFQQTTNKSTSAPMVPPASSEASCASGRAVESLPFSKTQLQDTLIHLIKNNPEFLSAIHEAYLQSVSKDLRNIKL
ncbi:mRNA-decapping enzyme 1A isoform X1 [Nothobranchius furzeri]|uniref:5'-(N(7)-methylguanosine 5'-triphospho)-[mRNA] hydrolase n=1 Tax=Nothobranchius furzeri TaxID=105023 RepID=A0A1A8USW7_NOTFU|nr:transcript variant X1 [Nothobranchius furzeri]